jgi:predicted Zn-ribbon and HTH transcriptional regulator
MFRKNLIDLLQRGPMSVAQIARATGESPGDIEEDLAHLFRSLKHTKFEAVVEPAVCRKCGFRFSPEKLGKPSKCPECKATWLTAPMIGLRPRSQ